MKIAHYVFSSIANPGGINSYVKRLARAQKEVGYEVIIYTRDCQSESIEIDGISIKTISSDMELYNVSIQDGIYCIHLHDLVDARIFQSMPVVLTAHVASFVCLSMSMMLKKIKKPCPYVYSPVRCLYNHFSNRCGSIRPVKIYKEFKRLEIERRLFPLMHIIIPSSHYMDAYERSGFPKEQLHYIPHFLNIENSSANFITGDTNRFLFHGRLAMDKGVDVLLHAASMLPEDVFIDVAGSGYYQSKLVQMAKDLHVSHKVIFHGELDFEGIKALMQNSLAEVVPSIWHETFCLSALEAQSYGRAVIAASAGGLKDIVVDGETGYLVQPGDSHALSLAMKQLVDDRNLAARMGQNAWKRAREKFSLSEHLVALEKVYKVAANQKEGND
ncbi:glycosyltransferase family 4 protein [Acidithiobacillus albertensis]|uniref:glycosyltransferase family 4 protein n=1 Tax=Acidithiobacillus albertensis TaxID=119978 RepID=UPI00094A9FF1|nr:glycosyltransferase family 4 protein [Acidithiobacillus albertensis]